ncbi:MAG: glycosyltransferase family 39 protein [Candidatus Saccharimonadales bacterium]
MKSPKKNRWFIGLFLLLCAVGSFAISRLFLIDNSLRLDEAQSLWQTSHSIPGTLRVVAQDVHVPLYHLILHFWQVFVGQSVESVRLLSFIFFALTIPFVYLLARRVLSVNWSLFVVFLFSFSPFMNWYANEARMYTLLALVATISQYYFVRLIESKGQKGWLGYTLSAVIGVYTHYFFLFNLIAQGLFFLFNRKKFATGTLKKFILLAILLLIELAPWRLYFLSLGSGGNTSPNLPLPSTVDFFNVYSQFSFGFQNNGINTVLVSMWPILVIVSLLSVKYGQKLTTKMGYIMVAAFVPILLAFGLSYVLSPFFLSRYMVACIVPVTILVVWFISNYRKSLSLAVSTVLVALLVVFSLQQYLSNTTPVKEDFRAAAEELNSKTTARDNVILSTPFTVYPFEYYYHGQAVISTLPIWNRSIPGPIPDFQESELPKQVDSLRQNHQYAYLLLSFDQGYEEQVFQYYEQHFERVEAKTFSPDLRLYVYRVGYNEVKPINDL